MAAETVTADQVNTYDQNADFWVQIIRGSHDRYRTGLTDAAMLDAIGDVTGLRVLDAGCGEGYLSRELASRGAASVLGVDSSERLIAAATELVPPGSSSLTFRASDVADLQVQDESFDLVVCNHLMNDLPDPTGPIGEFSRVLAPGGQIAILMLHPCFYIDRASRSDTEHQTLATEYFRPRKIAQRFTVDGITSPAEVTSWHRPLAFYVRALLDASLWIIDICEPHPSDEQMSSDPWWQAHFPIPLFLLLVAQKRV